MLYLFTRKWTNSRSIFKFPICRKIYEGLIYNELFIFFFFFDNNMISPTIQDLDLCLKHLISISIVKDNLKTRIVNVDIPLISWKLRNSPKRRGWILKKHDKLWTGWWMYVKKNLKALKFQGKRYDFRLRVFAFNSECFYCWHWRVLLEV